MATVQSRRVPRIGKSPAGTVAALDIGCSKITCLIGRNDGRSPRGFRILGAGRQLYLDPGVAVGAHPAPRIQQYRQYQQHADNHHPVSYC